MAVAGAHLAPPSPQPRPKARPGVVSLLDVDPDLGSGLAPDRAAIAHAQLLVRCLGLPRGEWRGEDLASISGEHIGLLLVDGVIARELLLEDTVSTELLGPGDLIRPWTRRDEPALLRQEVRWQVLAHARLCVLGRSVAAALVAWPEINAALTDRVHARAERLAAMQAISHLNSVERRLIALFWHLAERWGRVTADGVIVPLAVSHRLIGELVGARRPTISSALGVLEREGRLVRRADATWLITGEPFGMPTGRFARLIPHRRRLIAEHDGVCG